jgi:hypothetical protein
MTLHFDKMSGHSYFFLLAYIHRTERFHCDISIYACLLYAQGTRLYRMETYYNAFLYFVVYSFYWLLAFCCMNVAFLVWPNSHLMNFFVFAMCIYVLIPSTIFMHFFPIMSFRLDFSGVKWSQRWCTHL